MFAQSQTVGISIGSSVSEQGVDFVFGYKDIAIIPVAIEVSEGNHVQVGSMSGENFDDSFSVLASLK